jgi:hypothetical protein
MAAILAQPGQPERRADSASPHDFIARRIPAEEGRPLIRRDKKHLEATTSSGWRVATVLVRVLGIDGWPKRDRPEWLSIAPFFAIPSAVPVILLPHRKGGDFRHAISLAAMFM